MARNEVDPEQVLRDHAMAFPEATEHFPWGERVVKVRGKVFVFLSQRGKRMVTVKLPLSGLAALTLPFATPTGYGLGKSGWVSATFEPTADVPLGILKSWIEESYRAVAPKALAERVSLGADGRVVVARPEKKATAAKPAKPKRASTSRVAKKPASKTSGRARASGRTGRRAR